MKTAPLQIPSNTFSPEKQEWLRKLKLKDFPRLVKLFAFAKTRYKYSHADKIKLQKLLALAKSQPYPISDFIDVLSVVSEYQKLSTHAKNVIAFGLIDLLETTINDYPTEKSPL